MLKEADGVESSEESAVGNDVVESGGVGGGNGGLEMKKNRGANAELRKEGGVDTDKAHGQCLPQGYGAHGRAGLLRIRRTVRVHILCQGSHSPPLLLDHLPALYRRNFLVWHLG